jgi:uncharacterized membrane protein YgcG
VDNQMMTSFTSATASYEHWRARRIQVVEEDLATKHAMFRETPFVLFRGSPYRYHKQFATLLPELARAPAAVVAGDLHVENFGTWRDRDARLVWGAFDLDEIDLLPYTVDLIRLGASAVLACEVGLLAIDPDDACAAVEAGWRERVHGRRPLPFVMGDRSPHLFALVKGSIRDPPAFDEWVRRLPAFERALPKPAARMLAAVTPPGDFRPQLRRRVTGVGSLGARRIVAFGELDGGLVVREAKQVPGPVSMWSEPKRVQVSGLVGAVDAARGIAAEPCRRQSRKWVVRALHPDTTRLELAALSGGGGGDGGGGGGSGGGSSGGGGGIAELLHSMGEEAANLHLVSIRGAAPAKVLRRDDESRGPGWLRPAAETVAQAARDDFAEWSNS